MNLKEWRGMKSGQRLYAWVWTGGETHGIKVGSVVRVNRKTITVRWEGDDRDERVEPHLFAGVVDWAEQAS